MTRDISPHSAGAAHAWARAAGIALAAALALAAASQGEPAAKDDLARRTFANAEQLMKEGKIEQALRDFEQVSSAYPDSGMADDALYRIALHFYPVESVDGVGGASRDAIEKARGLFTTINSRYPREDSAPKALYKLGLIALDPSNPKRDLDEAYADFSAVVNIYPTSDIVDKALLGAGFADMMAGRYDKAVTAFEQVAEQYPNGPAAEEARFALGMSLARSGAFIPALEEFQRVRVLYPEGRLAGQALDRLTQIYRLKVQPGLAIKPLYALDAGYKPELDAQTLRGPIGLAVDASGSAHVLDPRTGGVIRLGASGKRLSVGAPLAGAVSISVDPDGVELLAAGDKIRTGVEMIALSRADEGPPRPLSKIAAAARAGPAQIAVLEQDRNEVLLYSGDPVRPKLLFRDPAGRSRLSGLVAGAGGALYTVDRRGRRILEISTAATFKEIPIAAELAVGLEDADLAADDLGDLFVLDRRADRILVITSAGALVETVASQPGGALEFSYPGAIAVGPGGEIYVYDEKRKTILKFR